MFKSVKTECPVCKTMQESDFLYHGPSQCGMSWRCGHEAHYKSGTLQGATVQYMKDGAVIDMENRNEH